MAKVNVTLKGVVCNDLKSLGTNVSRFHLLVTSRVRHNHNNAEELFPIPKRVPIDVRDTKGLCEAITAGKAVTVHVSGEHGNLNVEILAVNNCPGCMLDSFVD
jgi:hypothetical protein